MTVKVPLNSDFTINFKNFRSNGDDIDLDSVDNYVCVVSYEAPQNTYVVRKEYSITPSSFDIDIANRIVSVRISSGEISQYGTYYVNLYLYIGSSVITSLAKCFSAEYSVSPN